MDDGASTIFLNAEGTMDDISVELKLFLDYVAGKKAEDPYIDKLDEAVKKAKLNRKWRREYMTLFMRDQENLRQGIEKGLAQGREEGLAEGRNSMIINVLKNIKNIEQAASILSLPVDLVEKVARDNQISF